MRAPAASLSRPTGGSTDVDAARLHAHLLVLTKRDAVDLLVSIAGVSRAWACRHLTELHSLSPAQMAVVLSRKSSTEWIRKFRNLDPTGNTAAANVDRERASKAVVA